MIRRREFVTLLGGAAAAWSLAARAQHSSNQARIGILAVARTGPTTAPAWQAFFDELGTHGFRLGTNLIAETRWVDEDARGPAAVAAELVRSKPAILVVEGAEAFLKAAIAAAPTTPIVMSVGNYDPLTLGYVKSLARPGGNITGVFLRFPELAEKQVDLLAQAFPKRRRLAVLWDDHTADQFEAALRAAGALGMEVHAHKFARPPYDVDAAFDGFVGKSIELLLVQSSPLFSPHGRRIAELAIAHRLPSMFIMRSYVDRGGLMSYGADRVAGIRRTAAYVAKILNGALPADLPVEQPTKYELIVNARTARALGIELHSSILALANDVIE
jgi:putative tryptophan/tyrosine transport system substrate-binding protein